MVSLNCVSINKLDILASTLPNKNSSHSIPRQPSIPKASVPTLNSSTSHSSVPSPPQSLPKLQHQQPKPNMQKDKKKQPSVMEIEKAIGAGAYRDREPDRVSEENETLFDTIFTRTVGKTEGAVEKQLRETGEWVIDRTEKEFRSVGKPVLLFVARWIFPLWILAFCIASGIIKLPFNSAWLDDLIM